MEEQDYLNFVLSLIDKKLVDIRKYIEQSAGQVESMLGFMSTSFHEMDKQEVSVQRSLAINEDDKLARHLDEETRLKVQRIKPYFARFDFVKENENAPETFYIGIHNLVKENLEYPVVYDWRAPVSSMYYDYELGKASYTSEAGVTNGQITLKRQFKIEDGKLLYFFDSSIMVIDEILQEELSKNVSSKMKVIISTIQKEQNAVIRNEMYRNLIVQGYAGSGKTSIALHRVAYLLYRNKNLSSNEIMIISPNKVFSYYISGVLPELGEKSILEMTFLSLAKDELGTNFEYEQREQMIDHLLNDENRLNQAIYKEGFEFFDNLKVYLQNFANMYFVPKDLQFGKVLISKQQISKLYFDSYKEKTPAIRISWIADYIVDELQIPVKFQDDINLRVKKILYAMFVSSDIMFIYREFLNAVGLSDINDKLINYEDVAPLFYIKDYMYGITRNSEIKHLVIDEMQDFSPIHFDLFEKMFPCEKTILGDIYQSLFKKIDKSYLSKIATNFENSSIVELKKCYRSTKQIIDFAMNIAGISDADSVNRQGNPVEVLKVNENEYKETIVNKIYAYLKTYKKIAVICPTQSDAEKTYIMLNEIENMALVDKDTDNDNYDVLVMSTAFSKGLEFDAVIVLMDKFDTQIQKNLLFVSSTRALHDLAIISKGEDLVK